MHSCLQCHHTGAENDPTICRYNWIVDSFPNLTCLDHTWAEAILTSHLWNKWSPSGEVRDVPFLQLIITGVWDQREEGQQSNVEIKTMCYSAAIGGRLMMRALEQDREVAIFR